MPDIQPFQKLAIHFDTEVLPAPFCHRYRIAIQREATGQFSASMDLEYYGRDQITEDEILEEGFSLSDNYQWSGALPAAWGAAIDEKINTTNWKRHAPSNEESSLYLRIRRPEAAEDVWPADKRQWENFAQELIQAIFELGKKEAPLTIGFMEIDSKSKSVDFKYSFAERSVRVSGSETPLKYIDWQEGQKQLKYIFSYDYLPEDGIEKPIKPGTYIGLGDGLWYELGNGKPAGDPAKVKKLVELLKTFI